MRKNQSILVLGGVIVALLVMALIFVVQMDLLSPIEAIITLLCSAFFIFFAFLNIADKMKMKAVEKKYSR